MKKNNSILDSFNNAVSGIIFSIKYERNIRIHFITALLVFFYSLFLEITVIERLILYFSIAFVITAEMINTSIELLIDYFISSLHNPLIKIIKDISSGAVFVTAVNALIVGYFVIYKNSTKGIKIVFKTFRNLDETIIFISLIIIILLVVILKSLTHTGKPFKGGWPSGHSAFSYAIFAISILYIDILILNVLIFIMAFIISKSRIDLKIHNIWQVISGAFLGFFVTLLINNFIGG